MVGPKNASFAEESAEVELLLASLDKLTNLTKRIKSSLGRLEVSGHVVQEAIGPIYSNTQQLQIQSRNIERVNEAIERLRQPLDAKGREEGIIKAGPENAGLPQYLAALKRVDRALNDLNSSNLRSNQQATSEFHALLQLGATQVQNLFEAKLQEDAQSIEPLHYLTKQLPFPVLPQEKISYLNQIASAITSAATHSARFGQQDENVAALLYTQIRGKYVAQSLENLATASINTSKRKTADSSIYRQGTNGIGHYANAIEGMFLAEHDNISNIFRGDVAARVLQSTCASALLSFQKTIKELNTYIKSRIMYDFPLAYEIIDIVTPMSYRLEARTGQLRPQFSDALRPVRETARSSLNDILEQTKTQGTNVTILPSDGNTIPMVSETASRLYALAVFERPVASLLSSLGDGNWRTSMQKASTTSLNLELTPSTENPNLFSHYLLDLIDGLLTTLDSRSKTLHRTKPLQGIFLLNSTAILHRTITASADLSRYLLISPHNARLDSWRKTSTSTYLSAWREPAAHLLDTITTTNSSSGASKHLSGTPIDSTAIVKNLSSKDKEKIRDKFRAFNASFDELVARHRSLHMEKEVRAAVAKDVESMLAPLYARFWDRYHEVDKGKGKVVKYDKAALTGLLTSLV